MSVLVFENIIGKTITKIEKDTSINLAYRHYDGVLLFTFSDGSKFAQYHSQDCCESVDIESIAGDLDWLIGKPLVKAEIVDSEPDFVPLRECDCYDSETWTFVKFATNNGSVTIRWYGTSNGYYSETPDFTYIPVEGDYESYN